MAVGSALIPEFRGVNLSKSPLKIPDSDLRLAANCYPLVRGEIDHRPNAKLLGRMVDGAESSFDLRLASSTGLTQFFDHNGKHHLLRWGFRPGNNGPVFRMVELLSFNEDGSSPVTAQLPSRPIYWNVTTAQVDLPLNREAFREPTFLARNGVLYIFLGQGSIWTLEAGVNDVLTAADGGIGGGTSYWGATALSWNIAAPGQPPELVCGSAACEHNGQLVMAAVPQYPTEVFCADPADPGDLSMVAPGSRAFSVGAYDGDSIIAIVSVPVLDGATSVEPYLLVLKRHSVWMVQGYLPTSTSDGDLRITPVLRKEGCVSKATVVVTPSAVIWCSGKNVWRMAPGNKPEAIGGDIAEYLKTLPSQADDPAWWACWDSNLGCYRLSVPRSLGNFLWSWESPQPGAVATHHTEQWWCDLRDPENPAWWGPQTLSGVFGGLELREPGGAMLGQWVASGSGALNAYLVSLSSFAPNFRDFEEIIGTIEKGRVSMQVLETKEFDFGDPHVKKILEAVELFIYSTPNDAWKVYAHLDWGRSVSTFAPPTAVQSPAPGVELDVTQLDQGKSLSGGFESVAVYPGSSARAVARTFTLRFQSGAVEDSLVHRVKLAHLGIRVRVIGRRPTDNRKD